MKRTIAGVLLLVSMSVAPALAWNGGGDRGLRRDMRHDERKIAHDRRELRRDLDRGDYRAARRELRKRYRDLRQDRRELGWR